MFKQRYYNLMCEPHSPFDIFCSEGYNYFMFSLSVNIFYIFPAVNTVSACINKHIYKKGVIFLSVSQHNFFSE